MMTQAPQKKVLVTGATGSLGAAVVNRFLTQGYWVTGTAHRANEIEKADCSWIPVDLADPKSVKSAFSDSSFDIWVHCAGGFRFAKVDEFKDEDLDFLLNANLRSALYLARAILPGMKRRNFGRIIFVSAKATLSAGAGLGPYAASKAGLNALTATLAEEGKPYHITTNAVLPTIIDTPANRLAMPEANFSEWVKTDQLAEIIFSLVSSVGDPINGALIPVVGRV